VTDTRHPDAELTAFVTRALPPPERARVAAHLDGCPSCRQAVEESRAVLTALASGIPAPAPPDWGRYRADLRARLQPPASRAWSARSLPAMIAAGVATIVLLVAVFGLDRRSGELATVEETMLGARLPLLQQYRVVERLELLEDLDAIRQLDGFGSGGS
jgi:anti-sigma factor RsiW